MSHNQINLMCQQTMYIYIFFYLRVEQPVRLWINCQRYMYKFRFYKAFYKPLLLHDLHQAPTQQCTQQIQHASVFEPCMHLGYVHITGINAQFRCFNQIWFFVALMVHIHVYRWRLSSSGVNTVQILNCHACAILTANWAKC